MRSERIPERTLLRASRILWGLSLALLLLDLAAQMTSTLAGRLAANSAASVVQLLILVGLQGSVGVLGVLIVSRQVRNVIGWIFLASALMISVSVLGARFAQSTFPQAAVGACLGNLAQGPAIFGAFVFVFLLFPDGHLLSARWRPVAWLGGSALLLVILSTAVLPGPLQSYPAIENPFGIRPLAGLLQATMHLAFWGLMVSLLAAAGALTLRFRHSRGEERQQFKWVVSCTVLATILLLSGPIFWFILPPPVSAWWPVAFFLAVALIPAGIGIAMLKYRLYEIDLLINRALVYGSLTSGVVGLYVLVVGVLGNALHVGDSFGISLLATGLVAVFFQPFRERLQRSVNRLMYGERDDPYAVISRLGQRLEATLSPDALLPAVVETVGQALKLPYVAIFLTDSEGEGLATSAGQATGDLISLPLTYQREVIGKLVLAPRAPGETLNQIDQRLLADLARQASIAAHAVRLTIDLQRSRMRLVTAQEEERRRLRRDLHDGLGPSLAAQRLKVGTARALSAQDPATADELLRDLEHDMETALGNVRRLVYNLRPPALDELGLVGAISDSAAQYRGGNGLSGTGPSIRVDAPERLPDLPAAVEVAAYRIAQEAMVNVVRHAQASECHIQISVLPVDYPPVLELTIVDNGIGIPSERKAGVGLASLRERAAELGGTCRIEAGGDQGGTRVCARLPLSTPGAHSDASSAGNGVCSITSSPPPPPAASLVVDA